MHIDRLTKYSSTVPSLWKQEIEHESTRKCLTESEVIIDANGDGEIESVNSNDTMKLATVVRFLTE